MIKNKINRAICEYNMLDCSSLLVGFSGGADSCALLYSLWEICKEKGILLSALHVNHGIRGEEALRDEEFCRSFCLGLGIEFESVRVDIPKMSREMGMSTEECARMVRYREFDRYCRENGVERIATAHNSDDNRETVMFNLLRGTGIRGLAGIPPVRDNIIRPLLYCSKAEIIEYCRQKGIEYMNDSTNDEDVYTRNKIRKNIIPVMDTVNPSSGENILKTGVVLRQELEALDFAARQYLQSPDKVLITLPEALLGRVLAMRMEEAGFSSSSLEQVHYALLCQLMRNGQTNSKLSLPGQCRAIRQREGITFCHDSREKSTKGNNDEEMKIHPLEMGENVISSLDCCVDLCRENENSKKIKNIYDLALNSEIFFDTIYELGNLYVRAVQPGDCYRTGGMTRKVKKLLWQLGVPSECRQTYPIICDSKGPVLLPGFFPRDDYREKREFRYFVNVYLYNKKEKGNQ